MALVFSLTVNNSAIAVLIEYYDTVGLLYGLQNLTMGKELRDMPPRSRPSPEGNLEGVSDQLCVRESGLSCARALLLLRPRTRAVAHQCYRAKPALS